MLAKIKKELEKIKDKQDKINYLENQLKKTKKQELKKEIQNIIDNLKKQEAPQDKTKNIDDILANVNVSRREPEIEPLELSTIRYNPLQSQRTRQEFVPVSLEQEKPVSGYSSNYGIGFTSDYSNLSIQSFESLASKNKDDFVNSIVEKLVNRGILNPENPLSSDQRISLGEEVRRLAQTEEAAILYEQQLREKKSEIKYARRIT